MYDYIDEFLLLEFFMRAILTCNTTMLTLEASKSKLVLTITTDAEEGNFVFAMVVDQETVDIISIDARIAK